MNLSGRRAILTGAAGHIGWAAAETLVELGATVALLDVDATSCQERAADLARVRPSSASGFRCDLRDERDTRAVVSRAIASLGGLDILVHCAGYVGTTQAPGWAVAFDQQTVPAWEDALRVNLTSAFVMAQQARAALSASGHGSIVLLASIYGLVGPDHRLYAGTGMASPLGYAASKGGLLQLVRSLATELAPGIRVNAISPGGVRRDQPAEFQTRSIARTPLGRMAVEEDLKGAIAYLASDLSSYVTGHNLVVDGGWTAW